MQANSNNIKGLVVLFALIIFSTSCVEEYWPELDSNDNQILVVDGKITNLEGPYTVKISNSTAINADIQIPVKSAKVVISDDLGNTELLQETSDGIYQTSLGGIQGQSGRSYKLSIQHPNGKTYETGLEEMKTPVEVDEVYVEETWKLAENTLESDQEGFQFFVSSKRASTSKTYLFWEVEETYEYHSDYKIHFYYDGNSYPITEDNPYGFAQTRRTDTLYYCWQTKDVNGRFSYSTEYLSDPTVSNLPLHFIPFDDKKLEHKYSILVKQYSISENAYVFLDKLNKQNDQDDALFTIQPFQIRGNVVNTADDSEPVLGYFMVAAASFGPQLLTEAPARIRYNNSLSYADTTAFTINSTINMATQASLPIYFSTVLFEPVGPSPVYIEAIAFVRQDCLDCTRKGGTAIKPEYWDW